MKKLLLLLLCLALALPLCGATAEGALTDGTYAASANTFLQVVFAKAIDSKGKYSYT